MGRPVRSATFVPSIASTNNASHPSILCRSGGQDIGEPSYEKRTADSWSEESENHALVQVTSNAKAKESHQSANINVRNNLPHFESGVEKSDVEWYRVHRRPRKIGNRLVHISTQNDHAEASMTKPSFNPRHLAGDQQPTEDEHAILRLSNTPTIASVAGMTAVETRSIL